MKKGYNKLYKTTLRSTRPEQQVKPLAKLVNYIEKHNHRKFHLVELSR